MKYNKILNDNIIRSIVIIIMIIIVTITIINNENSDYTIDFNSLYSEVDKLNYESNKKVNRQIEGVSFYKPSGYTVDYKNGIFLENIYAKLNIIPDKLNINNIEGTYKINPNEEIIYEKINDNNSQNLYTNMFVWDIKNNMYEILLINSENKAIVGDINSKYIYQGVTEMAYVLNSM